MDAILSSKESEVPLDQRLELLGEFAKLIGMAQKFKDLAPTDEAVVFRDEVWLNTTPATRFVMTTAFAAICAQMLAPSR
jgi:hypothetical protein